jgi:hypothetical protein
MTRGLFGCVALSAFCTVGCASSPAPPFDSLKSANATAFRLQNYEPPQQPQAAPQQQPGAAGAIPGVPPEIQQWVQQGAAGLQQLIPPGLLPPGLIPPGGAAPAATAPQPTTQQAVPRFPNRPDGFRILSQTQLVDPDLKEDLADLLGDEDSFHNQHASCMYAELGLAWPAVAGGTNNEVLISFSCNQMAAAGGFAWPHPAVGMTPDTVKELAEIVNNLFPPGA